MHEHLPLWTPATKFLAGACFVSNPTLGTRVEFSLFPALYRRRANPPFACWDSGFHPWTAAPDLSQWTFRFPLADQRTLHADITYSVDDDGVDIVANLVNGTDQPQALALHGLLARRHAEAGPYRQPPLVPGEVDLPEKVEWISGAAFQGLYLHENSPKRHLPDDARPTGVVYRNGMTDGLGLGDGFGLTLGDRVTYALPPATRRILLRVRLKGDLPLILRIQGASPPEVQLDPDPDFQIIELTSVCASPNQLTIESAGGAAVELDGLACGPEGTGNPVFRTPPLRTDPVLEPTDSRLLVRYPNDPGGFELRWPEGQPHELREILSERLELDFPLLTHNHTQRRIGREGEQHYTNLYLRPITLAARETRSVRLRLQASGFPVPHRTMRHPATPLPPAPFGIERMRATLLTNLVYPVQYKRRYVHHFCPGKIWDSLYTWDSGFIGLGFCEVNPHLAGEILAQYLCGADDDFAYVHHGSTVPVQIYLMQALFNRLGGDRSTLVRHFHGARRMHRFLAGRAEGSATACLASGLLWPFAYFYNSGGWDDYPPQWQLWKQQHWRGVTPVITSAQVIRCARILRRAAILLGEDPAEFDEDIDRLSQALFRHAWNPDADHFSYVRHDDDGQPLGPLLHKSGEDANAGLDGLYPMLAGICPPEIEARFLERLQDPTRYWTPVGLSTVDQNSAVFRSDGYWNGAVWMPHQWFVWRYLLDIGESTFALQIADTALAFWERETLESWCCFEHIPINTARGAGWHQFSGLSTPVLLWHAALTRPGCVSAGYNTWILCQQHDGNRISLEILLDGRAEDHPSVWVVLPGQGAAICTWSGAANVACRALRNDLWELRFDRGQDQGRLQLRREVLE